MHYKEMLALAASDWPNECCGLLAGHVNEDGRFADVTQIYYLFNELQSPTEFLSDPKDMLAAMRDIREKNVEILAVYHSHPNSAPTPSQRDRERRYSTGVMDLIIGWKKNGEADVRGWWLSDSSFEIATFKIVRAD